MTNQGLPIAAALLSVLGIGVAMAQAPAVAQAPVVVKVCELPATPLGRLPGANRIKGLAEDRGIAIGGFSDLWRGPADPPDEFWTITDRGPNAHGVAADKKQRTFPVPAFTPLIARLRLGADRAEIREVIPLLTPGGEPVSGMPNSAQTDEAGFTFDGARPVPFNLNGVDPEGLVRTAAGDFWIAEEYGPSLVKVDATGHVRKRFVPIGAKISGAAYPVVEGLPAIYARREANRGFEALALEPQGKMLFAMMESPLENPDHKTATASAVTRILAFDIQSERPVGEYVYCFESPGAFGVAVKAHQIKSGALVALDRRKLLVLEHTEEHAKIFLAELDRGSNILIDGMNSADGKHSLEGTADLSAVGVRPVRKMLLADLGAMAEIPNKLEGLAVVDRTTLAVINDNDFGFKGFDQHGEAVSSGIGSKVVLLRLPRPLP